MLFRDYSEESQSANNGYNQNQQQFPLIEDTADVAMFDSIARIKEVSEENETPFIGCILGPESEDSDVRKAAAFSSGALGIVDLLNAYEAMTNIVFKTISEDGGPVQTAMVLQSILTKSLATCMAGAASNASDEEEE